jgi:hypothetical protein
MRPSAEPTIPTGTTKPVNLAHVWDSVKSAEYRGHITNTFTSRKAFERWANETQPLHHPNFELRLTLHLIDPANTVATPEHCALVPVHIQGILRTPNWLPGDVVTIGERYYARGTYTAHPKPEDGTQNFTGKLTRRRRQLGSFDTIEEARACTLAHRIRELVEYMQTPPEDGGPRAYTFEKLIERARNIKGLANPENMRAHAEQIDAFGSRRGVPSLAKKARLEQTPEDKAAKAKERRKAAIYQRRLKAHYRDPLNVQHPDEIKRITDEHFAEEARRRDADERMLYPTPQPEPTTTIDDEEGEMDPALEAELEAEYQAIKALNPDQDDTPFVGVQPARKSPITNQEDPDQ